MNSNPVTFVVSNPPKWIDLKLQKLFLWLFVIELLVAILMNTDFFFVLAGSVFANMVGGFSIYRAYLRSLPKRGHILNIGRGSQGQVVAVKKGDGTTTITVTPFYVHEREK